MPDLSWPGWSSVVAILLALIPAIFRFWGVLSKLKDLLTEIVGILVLMGGLFLYAVTVPEWVQIEAQIVQSSANSNPGLGEQVHTIQTLFFGSIGLMMLGGLLALFGLLGRFTMNMRKKW